MKKNEKIIVGIIVIGIGIYVIFNWEKMLVRMRVLYHEHIRKRVITKADDITPKVVGGFDYGVF